MRFLFVRSSLPASFGDASVPHYAGGTHGFMCCARSLAASGQTVELLFPCRDGAQAVLAAMQHGQAANLSHPAPGLVAWSHDGVKIHASLNDHVHRAEHGPEAALTRLMDAALRLDISAPPPPSSSSTPRQPAAAPPATPASSWLVLDADDCRPLACESGVSCSLLTAAAERFHGRVVVMVQNVHFLVR